MDRLEGNSVPLAGVDVWSIHIANVVMSGRGKQFQVISVCGDMEMGDHNQNGSEQPVPVCQELP